MICLLLQITYHQCLSKRSSFLLETYLNGYRNFLCLNSCHFKSEKAVSSAAGARRPRPVRNLGPPTIDCQASNKEPELSANGEPFHIKNVGMLGELWWKGVWNLGFRTKIPSILRLFANEIHLFMVPAKNLTCINRTDFESTSGFVPGETCSLWNNFQESGWYLHQ